MQITDSIPNSVKCWSVPESMFELSVKYDAIPGKVAYTSLSSESRRCIKKTYRRRQIFPPAKETVILCIGILSPWFLYAHIGAGWSFGWWIVAAIVTFIPNAMVVLSVPELLVWLMSNMAAGSFVTQMHLVVVEHDILTAYPLHFLKTIWIKYHYGTERKVISYGVVTEFQFISTTFSEEIYYPSESQAWSRYEEILNAHEKCIVAINRCDKKFFVENNVFGNDAKKFITDIYQPMPLLADVIYKIAYYGSMCVIGALLILCLFKF